MNWRGAYAIYASEMTRTGRTLAQSVVSPVISTALYFVAMAIFVFIAVKNFVPSC